MNTNSSTNMIGWTSSKTKTAGTRVSVTTLRRATRSESLTDCRTRAGIPDGARRTLVARQR